MRIQKVWKDHHGTIVSLTLLDPSRPAQTLPEPQRTSLLDPPKPFQTLQYPRHPSNPSKTLSNPPSTYPPPTHCCGSQDNPRTSWTLHDPFKSSFTLLDPFRPAHTLPEPQRTSTPSQTLQNLLTLSRLLETT